MENNPSQPSQPSKPGLRMILVDRNAPPEVQRQQFASQLSRILAERLARKPDKPTTPPSPPSQSV